MQGSLLYVKKALFKVTSDVFNNKKQHLSRGIKQTLAVALKQNCHHIQWETTDITSCAP